MAKLIHKLEKQWWSVDEQFILDRKWLEKTNKERDRIHDIAEKHHLENMEALETFNYATKKL